MHRVIFVLKNVAEKLIAVCLAVVIFSIVIVELAKSPTLYIYKKTEFVSWLFPREIYYFDAIGHGKVYDSIHIFKLSEFDGNRFFMFLKDKNNWNPLPIDINEKENALYDVEFDYNMRNMLSSEDGYWMISPDHKLFCVYDRSDRLLYVRNASSFTGYKWSE